MASGFQLVFLCLISGLLIGGTKSAPSQRDGSGPCCPTGWSQMGSRCFIFQNRHMTMDEAERVCISLGGNLASIHSHKEHMFLRELIYKGAGSYAATFVGGYDAIKDGKWMWTDGSEFDFTAWSRAEPNNHGGPENCLNINFRELYWNDLRCSHPLPFICAKDL